MTPAARVQAAIEILDRILAGQPAEKALTGWARASRFAGSKDRAAIRDHVFDALRCKRSFAAFGGGLSGRGLMLGACRAKQIDPNTVFTGIGHAPDVLSTSELQTKANPAADDERLDIPAWLWPEFHVNLGNRAEPVARALQSRAPVHLRVNLRKTSISLAREALAGDGIETQPVDISHTALEVTEGARRIRNSHAFQDGLVELQDAASQAVVDSLPLQNGMSVLDYCAGGGGKTLAMVGRVDLRMTAHDAAPARMKDLPARAQRAGVSVDLTDSPDRGAPFDLVLCDVPCSGSGSWRRSPEGKWLLTEEKLQDLNLLQDGILLKASNLVGAGGVLAYATCSVLDCENEKRVERFLAENPGWSCEFQRRWLPDEGADGFFVAHLTRNVE